MNREGKVEDDNRVGLPYRYLAQVHRAISSGANVKGYYVWSLLDNFEWGHGYSKRFGIVYIDFGTQQRILKKRPVVQGRNKEQRFLTRRGQAAQE